MGFAALLPAAVIALSGGAQAQDKVPAPPSVRDRPALQAPAATGPSIEERRLPPSSATGQLGSQVRTNVLSGKKIQAGTMIDRRPSTAHPEVPAIANRWQDETPVELGGFVGYLFGEEAAELPPASLGFDLHFATDPQSSSGGWLVQPGIDYSTALAPSWHLNTRLFSTYGTESSALGTAGLAPALRPGGSADADFKDVGVGLGLGYSFGENWNIQTQARYQRMLGSGAPEGRNDPEADQFFGGVMIDYRF